MTVSSAEFDAGMTRLRFLRAEMERLTGRAERREITGAQLRAECEPLRQQIVAIVERLGVPDEVDRSELMTPL